MTEFANIDETEIEKFDKVSGIWWDPKGEMGSLHKINPLRIGFITANVDIRGARILDVGCGGGILSESLAEAGARVTGIDLSRSSLQAASQHALSKGLDIDYRYTSLEELVQKDAGSYDVVTCMEMLEHVPDPARTIAACAQALIPSGILFCSTINRTLKSFLFAIIGGEYILHLLPRGSHRYQKLIRPHELKEWANKCGMEFVRLSSLMYNPFTRKFSVVQGKADVNYMVQFIKE